MGSQSKYDAKLLVYVNIKPETPDDGSGNGSPSFKYGFSTNISEIDRTPLGQVTLLLDNPPPRLVIGTSYPKPMRASRRKSNYFVSSFADESKRTELRNAGWQVSRNNRLPRIINATSAFVETHYVTVRGIKYAWQRPKTLIQNASEAQLTALGHKKPIQADYSELCFGAEFPRPPRASKIATVDSKIRRIGTFYDPESTLPADWTPSGLGRVTL